MRIIPTESDEARARSAKAAERALYRSGRLRVGWSQTRGAFAIFVSGRMEGPSFDSEGDAWGYLRGLGVVEGGGE